MAIERRQSVIQTDYHQFTIEAGPPRELLHGQDPLFPLALFAGDILRVNVGIRCGPVNVAVELHDEPPTYDDSEWEDSVEGDLIHNTDQGVNVLSFWDFEPRAEGEKISSLRGLTPPGRGRYRVRIYARGKDIQFDGYLEGDPVEDYLIQMWPTTEAEPPRQIKHTSGR